MSKGNHIATARDWRAASQASRVARAEPLRLPSGTTILAVKPEPLEWIMSGRIPQRLLGAALESERAACTNAERDISREEILDLARFAAQLVKASVVAPAIGDGPDEVCLDDISVEDRAFIFEWACRALGPAPGNSLPGRAQDVPWDVSPSREEDNSSAALERFRAK